MKRFIYNDLAKWKNSIDRKPLILLGARQVGKTFILKDFGRNEFENMVYVNCHQNEFANGLFRNLETERIVTEIDRFYETRIIQGKTLLIFDEIQEAPNGIASLKYFCEDMPQLHVVAAGSLLGISLRSDESYPVGKVNTLKMYPMSFAEFLLAKGRSGLIEVLKHLEWDSMKAMNEDFTELLRQYYFTGGMPEAVKTYIETNNVAKVRSIQHEILDAYERDIAKHTKTQAINIHQVWESIPAQLARENKKFIFGAVKRGARAATYETSIQWLVDAGLVYKVERVREPSMPLKFYADHEAFKLYLFDCGLLACMAEANPNAMLLGDNAFIEFKGAFSENFVLQQLKSTGLSVYYYSKEKSTMEVDFLYQTADRVVPIEVKAEENVKSKSLATFVNQEFRDKSLKAIRISMKPYIDQQWMENIPLYATESYINTQIKQ
ncbi:MAG: ATP-binding protein [Bacteroidales bacterium]|nr:ATP-binding protein [Bacteroidales bacterium]